MKTEKQQSAVEFLVEELLYYADSDYAKGIIKQAKEMEKKQIIEFAKKFSDFNGLTFNEQKVSKEYLEKFYTNKISKTKKCDWCNKRKIIDNGYCIGKLESSKTDKEFFICVDCNLKHDIV
jgi:hypothetical protein